MFTLKFYSCPDIVNGPENTETVVSGARYDVLAYPDKNVTIIVYQKLTSDQEGVEFKIGSQPFDYFNCFIENMSGKTIGRYSAVLNNVEPEAVASNNPS